MSVDQWADQLYGPVEKYRARGDGFTLWKRQSTAVNISRSMWEDRDRQIALLDVLPRRGEHIAIVVYFPENNWYAACAGFGCSYLSATLPDYDAAEAHGRHHERKMSRREY